MAAGRTDQEAVFALMDRLGTLIFTRDMAVIDELWSGAGFRLLGSELPEDARSREELAVFFAHLFAAPARYRWEWGERTVEHLGDLLWVCAKGDLIVSLPEQVRRKPYRAVCIFERRGGRWLWRLFSGSEPVVPGA
ncbi:nuclear transport factor 2 family protein [Zavarzinia sp.]|uniref:nuclear transport factor 2 family protein n=1 Tax=Zavarzinia sp. TaxID=2027920 RepID=UPI00356B1D47